MSLAKRLSQKKNDSIAQNASITIADKGFVSASCSCEYRDVPVYSPYGMESVPINGSDVLLVPYLDGYAMCGCKASNSGLQKGEVRISSFGGASILLKNNGDVVINGLTIKSDGTFNG